MNLRKEYIYLNRHCFLEVGKDGAAIYDLYTGFLYGIDREIGKLLSICEKERKKLCEILNNYKDEKKDEIIKYLDLLCENNLCFFADKKIAVEKIKSFKNERNFEGLTKPWPLYKLWLEITRECNLRCYHCHETDAYVVRCSCTSNNEFNLKPISLKLWKNIIFDSKLLDCREIHIIGGEPLLKKVTVYGLIKYANHIQIPKVVIHSNLTLLDREMISLFKQNDVTIKTVLFSYNQEKHDYITGMSGSFHKIVANIKKLLTNKVSI